MENVLAFMGIVLTACYALFVLSLFTGVGRLKPPTNQKTPTVTVVVAARNEEHNIACLLDALISQDYPPELYDIVIVNDRSRDRTREIVKNYAETPNNQTAKRISLIDVGDIPEGYSPKKYALSTGIEAARGEIICTTDADCIPPPSWISSMAGYFDDDVGMVVGYSPLIVKDGNRLFSEFLYIDSLSLATVSAGGIGLSTGWTCAGRNLAYRKSVFHEVGGFEDVKDQISGDDDLLMHLILSRTSWKLRYAAGKASTVPSILEPGLYRYVNQRTRHASKFTVYPLRVKAAAMSVFLFYLALGLYPIYMFTAWNFLPIYAGMAGSKFIVELMAVSRGAKVLEGNFSFGVFLRAFFIHPFLIVLFSIRGARGKFTWKEREFQ